MPDFSSYIEARRQRAANAAKAVAARALRARVAAERIAHHLAEHHGAQRVVLVGSLARGDFGADSDVDLVVWGLPHDALFRAGAEAEALADEFEVDLIPWESANARMRSAVNAEGVVLHGGG
jgi:predicted nucleotidyltransferase